MPKTQYYTATTLDGYLADEHNSLDWLFEVDEGSEGRADESGVTPFAAFFADVGAFAMGATTYEWVLDHDALLDNPAKWAEYYGDVPAWVFTHRDLPPIPGANLTFVRGDVRPVHEAMTKAAAGKNIWLVGGGALAATFADAGLLDEIIVGVAPVTLSAGAPLLPRRLTSKRLTLTAMAQRGQFAYLTYAVAPPTTDQPSSPAPA
ncbi:dihydrofolate reductase family protein [Paractinoplanes atraurantiacus]|uniref:Dihydrofolate reductase n=1 Tax=Paractinoplanes atraurantiacus TaxID=1036182 RepID=A0A285ICK1_9ACTN|nr:dihydrofolate reductase family protein [Actinoplanes atraurantiacus]SNY44766.1 Dihydrofolate reductase [Actinoplanes atraurantiacus]